MFTWSVYVGADTALRDDKMVNVEIFQQFLKPKTKKILQLFIYILILIFLLLMVYYGFYLAYSSRFRTFQGIPFLSYTWATLSMTHPLGFHDYHHQLENSRSFEKRQCLRGSAEVR
jgi:TRAP-type C4-dicarboxylate transport system permease small subunit